MMARLRLIKNLNSDNTINGFAEVNERIDQLELKLEIIGIVDIFQHDLIHVKVLVMNLVKQGFALLGGTT